LILRSAFILFSALTITQSFAQLPLPEEAVRADFKKGVEAFQQKQFESAEQHLTAVPELGGYLSTYKHWYLGQVYLELGKFKESEPEFSKVMQSQVSNELKLQGQYFLGEAALRQKKYNEVIKRLTPLERKWRHSYRLPEVLYRIMVADFKMGRTDAACKRARKLYSDFPAHALVIGWGHNLSEVKLDDKKIPCKQGRGDFADRVKSLQWAGESDKAHKEITEIMGKITPKQKLEIDLILANFLVNEGSVDDALNLLIRYYPQQKSNMGYLMLLGKAAARSGEYQTAVGAFERAHSLSPRSKRGREALYQAAYLSYQFQDYDGAVRKFQQFAKANPRSGLTKDAQWHLAWLQYLRNDFKGALEKFKAVKVSARKRRKSDSLQERLDYWIGMSNIRLKQYDEARAAFEAITAKNEYSYYGLAAQARLDGLKSKIEEKHPPRVPTALRYMPIESNGGSSVGEEEKESEEDIAENEEEEEGLKNPPTEEESESDEIIHASAFKDPALRARIDVAQKLTELNLFELARWELWEVEKRTRNPQYLRQLIGAYEGIGSYHRSAAIAELSFSRERESQGLEGARALWQSMYPQAFKPQVQKASKQYGVPEEWVWAIMRSESLYKPDVISPVGAKGLMQLMPYTANNLRKLAGESTVETQDLINPDININLGTQYLARLQAKFKGQLPLVAAAYNAGPHRVESWLVNFGQLETDEFVEHIPFLETRNYVKKVVRHHTLYRRLYAKDLTSASFLAKSLGVPIPSRASTRESWDTL
jgi:soluble lytic murein transglycosylase